MAHAGDLNLSVLVTREHLGLPPLQLNDKNAISPGNGFEIMRGSLGPGDMSWRRNVVTSPWIDGESTVMAVRNQVHAPIGVRCFGSNLDLLTDVCFHIQDCFSQYRYTVEIKLGDSPWGTWLCDQADWTVGDNGSYNEFKFRRIFQEIKFTVPRLPVPTHGPF